MVVSLNSRLESNKEEEEDLLDKLGDVVVQDVVRADHRPDLV